MNNYSATWFDLFLSTFPIAQTDREVAFLVRHLPQPRYYSVLDVCCGTGRHAQPLAAHGYDVLGIDRDLRAIAHAQTLSTPNARYCVLDMRQLADVPSMFDGIICLWQSFGYFDATTNSAILDQISRKLHGHGRLILDIYNREFFERYQGIRTFEKDGIPITEHKTMHGDRLIVRLIYGEHGGDTFDWQLWTPDQISAIAAEYGLQCQLVCTNFDEDQAPSATQPRVQLVFEKQS